jgi:hypothetical protein
LDSRQSAKSYAFFATVAVVRGRDKETLTGFELGAEFADFPGQAAKAFDVASCKSVLAIYSVRLQMIPKEDKSDRP